MKNSVLSVIGVVLGLLLSSCATPASESGTRVIDSVSPYSTLSDSELNAKYLVRLLELQTLNKEMTTANSRGDFATVNSQAEEGLKHAYDARNLARHIDDPKIRQERLDGINKIIVDLEKLVQITS